MGLFHWWRQASVVDRAALERFGARHADVGLRVEPGVLQREAPCHVDGFQGARWDPKVRLNHTYTMGDAVTPENGELTLMDAYCVHRGSPAPERVYRTWIRLSFEVRKFDYDWEMVPRDIESLNLRPFDETMDPSLRVFPWQDIHGNALPKGAPKTKPNLGG